MKIIEYFSNIAMPLMIIVIVIYGVVERKKVFDIFLEGAKEGIGVVLNIFPTLFTTSLLVQFLGLSITRIPFIISPFPCFHLVFLLLHLNL